MALSLAVDTRGYPVVCRAFRFRFGYFYSAGIGVGVGGDGDGDGGGRRFSAPDSVGWWWWWCPARTSDRDL